jgi:hypothetical protein
MDRMAVKLRAALHVRDRCKRAAKRTPASGFQVDPCAPRLSWRTATFVPGNVTPDDRGPRANVPLSQRSEKGDNAAMRIGLMLVCLLVSDAVSAQTAPATAAPAPTRKPQPAPSRAGMALTVTDARGGTLAGIQVEADGPSDRSGETNTSGQINFTAMQPGTYRVRFSGDEVITFEREIAVRAGQIASADIVLTPAPPPERPEPADPPPPAPA